MRGASLEFSEQGSGDPLVLVHGSVSDQRTWAHLLGRFGKRYRAIALSRRYHWPNDSIPEGADYSMPEQVDDLAAFVHGMGAEPAHLVGHSYGAYLALLLAIRRPDSVRSLVLAEPPVLPLFVSNPPKPAELFRVLIRRPRTGLAIMRFGARGIEPATAALGRGDRETALRLFGTAVLGRETFNALSEDRLTQVRANLIPEEFLGSGFVPLDERDVATMKTPTLLLGGERSPALFGLLLDRLEELIPTTRRALIAEASHIMHEDNPEAFFEHVSEFLGSEPG